MFNQTIFSKVFYVFAAFFAVLMVSACSFAPVFSDPSVRSENFNFSFDEPNSRLEQIVYNDLVAHFGRSTLENAKNVNIVVSSSSVTPGSGSVGVSGVITVKQSPGDDIIFSGTRTASATYVSTPQQLANQQAANEASERAAHQLAQTIRLTLIGVISFPPTQ